MTYILAVNPAILASAGMDRGGVLIATALAAFVGTMLMAWLANYPFALAPSMGLNAYFALACSASIPVPQPRIIVIDDVETSVRIYNN